MATERAARAGEGERPTRVLILTASIGEGHDLPARLLADGLRSAEPDCEVRIVDFIELSHPLMRSVIATGSEFESPLGNRIWDAEHRLMTGVAPLRGGVKAGLRVLSGGRVRREVRSSRPDAIVATYPAASEILGQLRRARRDPLRVPVASAVTDLASLLYWAHAGIDLHLLIHPESEEEVRSIAPQSRVVAVRGLSDPSFYDALEPSTARRALGLPVEGPLIVVSGGGWAVGDLDGAVQEALAVEGSTVVCLCGRKEEARAGIERRFDAPASGEGSGAGGRLRVWGFTGRMGELLAAADVLVHSTAGLTVLEALIRGTRVVSYGWGIAHIRDNNAAYERFGLARVAATRAELKPALAAALAEPRAPDPAFAAMPEAADEILALAGRAT